MTADLLIVGVAHLAMLVGMALLPRQVLLHPSLTMRMALGLALGVASVLLAQYSLSPYMAVATHAHPAVLASAMFLFGPYAGGAAAMVALGGLLLSGHPVGPSVIPVAVSLALGGAWWAAYRWRRVTAIWAVFGLAATLALALQPLMEPPDFYAMLTSVEDWLLYGLPWRYVISALCLCGGTEMLRSRARAMNALRQHEAELLGALRASGDGRWEWDVRTRHFSYYGRLYRSFGLSNSPDGDAAPVSVLGDKAFWRRWNARRHPDDLQRLALYLRRALNGQEEVFNAEFRMRDDQGRWRWLLSRARAVEHDADGRVLRLSGLDLDVTEHHAMREALSTAEAKYTTIYQTLPDAAGITRMADGCYLDVNPAFERLCGLPNAQIVGRTYADLGVWGQTGERERLMKALRTHGEVRSLPMTALRGDEEIPGLMSARTALIDGEQCMVFVFHDMAQEQRVRSELLAANQRLARLFQLLPYPLGFLRRSDGAYLDVNPAWEQALGYSRDEAVGRQSTELGIIADDVQTALTAAAERQGYLLNQEIELTTRTGARRTMLLSLSPMDVHGEACWLITKHDITERKQAEQQHERQAHYDALTDLPNRVMLQRRLRASMDQCRTHGMRLGVGYLDLDGFKPVNDRLGHAAGDRLLVMVAKRLKRALRQSDCVARLGGDEFVILLPGLADGAECEQRLLTIMHSISAPYTLDAERVLITASIGYTLYPDNDANDSADADTLLRHADQAMYAAKQAGRNRLHAFNAAQEHARQALREHGTQLAQALARGELALYLQPKVNMYQGRIVGAEALARWRHPEQGVLLPGQFLYLIDEQAELHEQFGEWVVNAALDIIEALMRQGLHLPLSINITSEQLHRPGFAAWIAERMAQHPEVPPRLLNLELTESAALYDIEHVAHELEQLRAMGIGISFDDFGTGYSSLAYLRRLPLDHLKLDRSFVAGMLHDAGDRAIVQGVIGLAQSFGCEVVAEGVETIEQGSALLRMGCHLAQGYCIARPMPAEQFAAWSAAWRAPEAWQADTHQIRL